MPYMYARLILNHQSELFLFLIKPLMYPRVLLKIAIAVVGHDLIKLLQRCVVFKPLLQQCFVFPTTDAAVVWVSNNNEAMFSVTIY